MKPEKSSRMMIRLNKFLADSGVASRRKAEEFILQGRVAVNGELIKELSFKVDSDKDTVSFDGENISPKRHIYFLLNKPRGVVTTTNDEKKRDTVTDLIKTNEKIFPVGRLDYNTTGVLLLTNDGEFSNLLTHPRNNVPRTYEVILDRPLEETDQDKLLKGVYIDGVRGKFKSMVFPKKSSRKRVNVVTVEGRNHFVKNMFKTLGYSVTALNRSAYGVFITDIPVGHYRTLAPEEIEKAIKAYGKVHN